MVYYFYSLIFSNLIIVESSFFGREYLHCISKGFVYLTQRETASCTLMSECIPSTGVVILCSVLWEGIIFHFAFSCVSMQTSKRWIERNLINDRDDVVVSATVMTDKAASIDLT